MRISKKAIWKNLDKKLAIMTSEQQTNLKKQFWGKLQYKVWKHYKKKYANRDKKIVHSCINNKEYALSALLPDVYKYCFLAKRKSYDLVDRLLYLASVQETHQEKIERFKRKIQSGKRINIAFFLMYDSAFMQIKPIYDQFAKDGAFNPFIIVTPDISRGDDNMYEQMNKTIQYLKDKNVHYFSSYDEENSTFIDFSHRIDLLYSVNPYQSMDHPLYQLSLLVKKDILPFYISYFYLGRTKYEIGPIKSDAYSLYWKIFTENYIGEKLLVEHSHIDGMNAIVSGYLKMDPIVDIRELVRERKRIIISPHHTVGNNETDVSTFMMHSDYYLNLPKKYPEIDFVYRPHPLLKVTLTKDEYWGADKTDQYFKMMTEYKNVEYQDGGDYLDTFVNSDALIHDGGSFLAEYCYTDHPQLYVHRDDTSRERIFLPFGKEILDLCYEAYGEDDIDKFIREVVLSGNDFKKEKRIEYANNEIRINVGNATSFVVNYIKSELGIKSKGAL